MFDTVRNNSKIMMGLLFLLVIPSFVMFGIEGYSRFNERGAGVAVVDGQKITQAEWDDAHKREVERIRAQMPKMDPKLLDSDAARMATLDRLMTERVMSVAAQKQMLVTSDARLARELQQSPSIAGLRAADGKLDMERYRQLAASQGMTPEMFENQVRLDLSNRQVINPIQSSVFATPQQTDTALQAYLQRREVQVKRYSASDFASKVMTTEDELIAYYKNHAERFRSPESADVEYLVLDVHSLMSSIQLAEQDVKSYYEQNVQRLSGQEQRRASHVLITVAKDASEGERKKARGKAEELLAQLRKSPKSFAEVARKHSQDPGSAAKGGDLEFFSRGAMVKPFEDVVFTMKEGEISNVVESDFGFHIIQLTGVKAPKAPSFDSMRPQLEADLRKQQAQRKFAELADSFTNGVYEQSDSLKPVADKLKLMVQYAKGITRMPGSVQALANPKLLQALFSEDTVSKHRNTEAVEVAPNTLVSARISQYHAAAVRPFEEVKEDVKRQFVADKSAELARAEGSAQLAAWKDQVAQAQLGAALVVSRDQPQDQPQALLNAALRADPAKLPALVGVDLGGQGYAVVRVNKIVPRESQDPQKAEQTRQQFTQMWGQAEVQAYLAALKSQFKAEILTPKSVGKTASPDGK